MATSVKDAPTRTPAKRTKVSSKNQVTLPVAVLSEAHIHAGDHVRVEVIGDGEVRLIRERDPFLEALDEFLGSAPGIVAATDLEGLRDEWER
jgi:AbrB family looped-hinge helix DNA binding protein